MKTIVANCQLLNVVKFIDNYGECAIDLELLYDIPAEAMLAQAALETGWGKYILLVYVNGVRISSNNMFNIKVHYDKDGKINDGWKGVYGTVGVREVINGKDVFDKNAVFRVYNNYRDSFFDYCEYIKTRKKDDGTLRYSDSFGLTNAEEYIDAISNAGYATDPKYAVEIKKIMKLFKVSD